MNVENVGAALRRKLGPLPVWVWAVIGGGILYVLRSRGYLKGLGGGVQSGETLQPSQANATPPQEQVPLQPGESVYDPNTGALSTAPGGDTGTGNGTDSTQAIDDLASAIAAGFTTHVTVSPTQPATHPPKPGKHHKKKTHPGKRGKKGKKGHGTSHKTTTKHPHHLGHPGRPRSTAKVRNAIGGRIKGRGKKPAGAHHTQPRTPTTGHHAAPGSRQRPTTNTVTHSAPVQHPASAHTKRPKQGHPVTAGGPRASAPPPRHQRAPAKAPHRPRGKR